MTAYASADDLRDRWPSLPAGSDGQADALLDDASLWIRSWYPGIDDQVTAGTVDAGVLRAVSCSMVKRALLQTTPGAASESTTTGPYGHSVTFSNPDGNLYITKAEDGFIRGYQPRGQSISTAPDIACATTIVTENGAIVALP